MQLIFVYGSLKKGFHNHAYFLNRDPLLLARLDGYQLLDRGVGYPAITEGPGFVEGEVYEVNDSTLQLLDQLESHPRYYVRSSLTIFDVKSKQFIDVMSYVILDSKPWRIYGKTNWQR